MSEERIVIVEAQPDDIQFAFELGCEFHAELAESARFPRLSPTRVYTSLRESQELNGLFIAVDTQRELPVGCVAMVEMPYWYSDERFATDLLFYVSPSGRGTGAARLLLERAKAWAEERDLLLMMAVTAGGDVDAKDKFFKRRNLTRIGGIYLGA